jgi:hypothetical protein
MSVPGAAQPAAKPDGEASDTPDEPAAGTATSDATDATDVPQEEDAAPDEPEADDVLDSTEAPQVDDIDAPDEYLDGDDGYPDDYEEYPEEAYERPPLSKLAVVAMISGLLALLPLALGFGIAALVVIRRTGRRGSAMALTGIYAAWIWVLVGGAAAALIYFTHGFSPRVQVRYRPAAAYSLQPGDCINRLNDGSYSIVSCSTSHDAEVYGRFSLTGKAYPGSAAIQSSVSTGCAGLLTSYMNPQYADIGFSQEYVYPDQSAWAAGERTVICEASFDSGAISGSIRKQ